MAQHVEYEPESYYAAFSAELEICASPMWALLQHLEDEVKYSVIGHVFNRVSCCLPSETLRLMRFYNQPLCRP